MTGALPAAQAAELLPRRAVAVEPDGHTMSRDSLLRYLTIKVHHLAQDRDWRRIRVVGDYDRDAVVSVHEKTGKLFNWQRPTAEVRADDELIVKCFPGADYVHHYGLIISTFLAMTGRPADHVTYEIPDSETCDRAVEQIDLALDGDLVIVGWGLEHLATVPGPWTYGPGHAWKRAYVHGRSVVYLGVLHSIWGDVAGRVVTRLAALGADDVVYVGKVGALDRRVAPNTTLATGNLSLLGPAAVTWPDFFGDVAACQPGVLTGIHVTSPSVLLEDRRWLAANARHAFVDPEIGPMGAAAVAAGIGYGYLHVISNNLAHRFPADLSNERHRHIVRQRAILVGRIRDIIAQRLAAGPA